MTAIQIDDVVAGYGRRRVLEGLSFQVPEGSATALLGDNGAGKSTLVRVLTGRLRPKGGQVRVLGLDPRRRRLEVLRRVGLVPEGGGWTRSMRVRHVFELQRPLLPTWDVTHEAALCQRFDLDPARPWHELSKGGRAAVALCAALAHRPRVLILDEPFSGLDVGARRAAFDALLEHLAQEGAAALVISHSLADVERCADRVVRLAGGRAVLEGDLEQVLEDALRVRVELGEDSGAWTPPGQPLREDPSGRVLFYPGGGGAARRALEADPAVRGLELLPRSLEDVLAASPDQERCA